MHSQDKHSKQEPQSDQVKKVYHTPHLEAFGHIREFTKASPFGKKADAKGKAGLKTA